jgi:hypothetical protein
LLAAYFNISASHVFLDDLAKNLARLLSFEIPLFMFVTIELINILMTYSGSMKNNIEHMLKTFFSGMPTSHLDRLMLFLIFMFPLCGNLVKSWYSTFFGLIAITSLFYIKKGWPLLDKYQKSMAYALLLYFLVFLLNATLLGWQSTGIKALGVEIRLIFILPFLCMATVIPTTRTALYLGLIGSLLVFLGQAFYELIMMQHWRVIGVYNPLRISAMTLVAMSLLCPWLYFKQRYIAASLVVIGCAIVIVASQGRMVMIAALIISVLFSLCVIKNTRSKVIALIGVAIIVSASVSSPLVQHRFTEVEVAAQYIMKEKQYAANEVPMSWVTHYMMLEASWLLFKDNPILGVGSKNYPEHVRRYIEAEQVHPIVGQPGNVSPHTLIAEIAVSKGFIGILAFSLFIIMAARLAYHQGQRGVALGLFIMCVLLTGISEAWWVRIGSFAAIMVLFIAILSPSDKVKSID